MEQNSLKKVYLYNIDRNPAKGQRIRDVITAEGYDFEVIGEERLVEIVGRIVGLEGYEDREAVEVTGPPKSSFALFNGFSDEELEALITAMRNGRANVGAKAVMTEYNKEWPLVRLMEAVVKEHAIMKKYSEKKKRKRK